MCLAWQRMGVKGPNEVVAYDRGVQVIGKPTKSQSSKEAIIVLGISFGVALGAVIGSLTGNVGLSVALGTSLGLAGGCFYVWFNSEQDSGKD